MSDNKGIVYSTATGKMCPSCGRPVPLCQCGANQIPYTRDGIVRVRREINGRGGKTVTVIYGLPLSKKVLEDLASEIKRRFGTGGSVKNSAILIQGDRCDAVIGWLEQKGYKVKRAGG